MEMRLTVLLASALSLLALPSLGASRGGADLPEKFEESPFSLMSLTIGHPNGGYQVRAKRLREAAYLKVRASSATRSYGHPALVLMLRRSALDIARAVPGSVMLVGDLSFEGGGPISGHRSHQSGRDADIAFYVTDGKGRPQPSPGFVAFDGNGKARDGSGLVFDDHRNWLLLQSWAKDQRAGLSHVFISAPLKTRLLRFAQARKAYKPYIPRAQALLKQPERGEPHDDHFHVRVSCPSSQKEICREESK